MNLLPNHDARIQSLQTRLPITITLYKAWTGFTIVSFLLTLSALIYTFVVINKSHSQQISVSGLRVSSNPSVETKYQLDSWTPQTWYSAVLKLELVNESDRKNISSHLKTMRGWEYNLIVLFLLHLAVCGMAVLGLTGLHAKSQHSEKDIREGEIVA
jgi:hypothetical protein